MKYQNFKNEIELPQDIKDKLNTATKINKKCGKCGDLLYRKKGEKKEICLTCLRNEKITLLKDWQ